MNIANLTKLKICNWFCRLCIISLFLFSVGLYVQAQERTVSGKVTADDGNPLPGANVVIKGTSLGVINDMQGNYTITVASNEVMLIYSFVGYKSKEVLVGDQSVINVVLEEDVEALEEVVVVGYGTQKKSDITGAMV